ncbi:LuxR C-terminal-related transcriptional regulator, partial [Streptomyces pathocidini]|uniref:LuxR C-terminal-related transcriptional regulator n=1 Tax=Streptomyces pathocidini TaxID=1650571 RepID=UPI0033D4ACCD
GGRRRRTADERPEDPGGGVGGPAGDPPRGGTSHLYAELRRTRPAEVPRLHGAAADWFAARERPAEALRHAVAVPDPHRVSALLDRHVTRMVTAGQGRTVRRLLAELPEPALESEPGLLLAAALARLDTGDLDNGSRYLALSTRADPHPRDSGIRALRRIVRLERARLAGSLPEALRLAEGLRIPEAADRDGGDDLAALALADRGIVHMEFGQLTQGKADLAAALAIARRRGLDHLTAQCLSCLAAVAAAECRNTRAVRLGEAAADFARARGWEGAALCAPAYEAVAWAELQLTERDPAERWSRLARQSVRSVHGRVDPTVEFGARLVGAVAAYERGERERGLVGLRRAWTACGDRQLMPELSAFGSVAEVQMALAAGRIAWAAEALGRARERLDGSAETAVMESAVLAARGRDEAARAALRRALDGGRPPVVVSTLVEAWLLEARLCEARGERPRAAQALREAMGIARSRRVLRPFRVGGPGLRQLLIRSLPGLGPLEPFGHELLRVVPDTGAPPPVSALTPRETALLQQLPSLRTMEEIAADLFVSVNTLKTHLRGIYRKLEVGTRRDAVLAAREKGLL